MAIIYFNGKSFKIPEAALGAASGALRTHLSTVMNGTGAIINFGGAAYGIDSAKLATATNAFITHLGTVAGNGYKVKIGGVEFSVDSTKVAGAFDSFNAVLNDLVASGGGTLGFPIIWNSMEVMGNPSVIVGGEMPFVKVSDFIPTAEDFVGTGISAMGEVFSCEDVQEMSGLVMAMYSEGSIFILSVATAGEYADLGVTFSETGLYALDFGAMGIDADFTISPPMPTLAIPIITLTDRILTISPVENATGYEIYADNELICTTVETTIDLSEQLLKARDDCQVSVVAIPSDGYEASYATITYTLPMLATPELSISGQILTISPVENATGYEIYADNELAYITTEITVDLLSVLNNEVNCYIRVCAIHPGSYFPANSVDVWYSLTEPEPGLFDADGALLASWHSLVNNYKLNVEKNYSANHKKEYGSLYYILSRYSKLSTGAKLVIPKGVACIGDFALSSCKGLTSVTIPDSVTSIGRSAFNGCLSLYSIVLPHSITSIGTTAFADSGLTSVNIPDGVTSINNSTFNGCKALTSIKIPCSITYIGDRALMGCTSLTSITFDGTVEQWNAVTKAPADVGMTWHTNVPATYVQCSDGQVAL